MGFEGTITLSAETTQRAYFEAIQSLMWESRYPVPVMRCRRSARQGRPS